jgi:hypothetical protein
MPGSFRVHFPAQRQEAGVLFGILIYEGVEPFDLATYVVLSMALFARSGRAVAHPPCPKAGYRLWQNGRRSSRTPLLSAVRLPLPLALDA